MRNGNSTGSSLISAVEDVGFVAQLIGTKREQAAEASDLETCELSVYGMTCQSCEAHLEKVIASRFPVRHAKFDASAQSAVVHYPKGSCNSQEIADAITDMGFDAFVLHKGMQLLFSGIIFLAFSWKRLKYRLNP
uniref:HMA domain-containing protein n=1 Tax=Trichuris muris TaxID=70415 RepID=A0A5S6Q5E3_TRIMR